MSERGTFGDGDLEGDAAGTGTMVATAQLPNAEITEIGTDRVVAVSRHDDDVPYVRVFRLVKSVTRVVGDARPGQGP